MLGRKEVMPTVVLLEVLNDPLGIVLAKRGLAGERVCDRLSLRVVFDCGRAACFGGCLHSGSHGVAGREANPREVVHIVRVPLVPS